MYMIVILITKEQHKIEQAVAAAILVFAMCLLHLLGVAPFSPPLVEFGILLK